jgi:phosphoglycolate phosphatase
MKKGILFDLDGTLTDPKEGITKSVQFALLQQGIHEKKLDKLEPFIGPPLKYSFMEFYRMSEEEAVIAVGDYRKRFAPIGIFENKVYPV